MQSTLHSPDDRIQRYVRTYLYWIKLDSCTCNELRRRNISFSRDIPSRCHSVDQTLCTVDIVQALLQHHTLILFSTRKMYLYMDRMSNVHD